MGVLRIESMLNTWVFAHTRQHPENMVGGGGVGGEGGLEGEGQQGERYRIEALSKAKRPLRLCLKYNTICDMQMIQNTISEIQITQNTICQTEMKQNTV